MLDIKSMSMIITGGCTGLGYGMAKQFSEKGARITICGRRPEKVEEAGASLGKNVRAIVADVTKEDDRNKIVKEAINHGKKIDVLGLKNKSAGFSKATDNLPPSYLEIVEKVEEIVKTNGK